MASWEPLLTQLLSERRARLQAYAVMLAGPSLADDLVQEALITVFSKNRGLTSIDSAEAYVKRTITTKYIDLVRKDRTERLRMERASAPDVTPDHTTRVEGAHVVDAALAALPPRVRACVALRYLEDQSTRETAAALGISEGAVKRYLADGLSALNAALGTQERLEETSFAAVQPTKGAAS